MQPDKVAIIGADWPIYELYCPNFTGMQAGLKALGIEHRLFGCRPTLDVDAVIAYEPDLVIYGLLDLVKAPMIRARIRAALPHAKIVMWYGDLRNEQTGQVAADMSEIDMMFVSNAAQNEFYKKLWRVPACHFLPLGCQVYNPSYNRNYVSLQFIFIGGMITSSAFFARAKMMLQFKEAGLKIINASADAKPELRAKILQEMPAIYRTAKISLDVSHFTDIPGYTSNRFWIIPASGGFALTKRWPGCTDFYPEGTRAYFDTFEEALELRSFYLTNSEAHEKIRKAGYEHAKFHTYEQRFRVMFEKLYGSSSRQIDHARQRGRHARLSSRAPEQKGKEQGI